MSRRIDEGGGKGRRGGAVEREEEERAKREGTVREDKERVEMETPLLLSISIASRHQRADFLNNSINRPKNILPLGGSRTSPRPSQRGRVDEE